MPSTQGVHSKLKQTVNSSSLAFHIASGNIYEFTEPEIKMRVLLKFLCTEQSALICRLFIEHLSLTNNL